MDVGEPLARDRLTWTKRERCNAADFHLAVCDPLSSRYVLLPTIPEDLAAQPTSDDGEEQPFKVISIAKYQTKLVLFVFPSTTMQWSMVESPIFPSLKKSYFDCVRGCFYWTQPYGWSDHLMVLDTHTLRFSTVNLLTGYHVELRDLPDQSFGHQGRPNAVVLGREGTLEMFSLVCQLGSFALCHTSLQNNSQEWKLEKVIQLPRQYHNYSISTVGAAEGFLFFRGTLEGIPVEDVNVDCYSMEVKTYGITKVCTKTEKYFNRTCTLPYFSFPPLLSEPTI
uniref:F-box associated domain-containing protein n=1 Tax=Aegilops tauschii TaxID=37682 RepID=N1R3G4_AEGTA